MQNAISLQKYTYITGTNKATELCNLGKFCTRRINSFCTRLFQRIISTFESVKSLNAIRRKDIALAPLSVETNQRVYGPSPTPCSYPVHTFLLYLYDSPFIKHDLHKTRFPSPQQTPTSLKQRTLLSLTSTTTSMIHILHASF